MRLDAKLLHPSVKKPIDAFVWTVGDQSATAYQAQWTREQGAGAFAYVFVATTLFAASILGTKALPVDKSVRTCLVLFLAVAFATTLIVGAMRQSRNLSAGQMEALLPTLDLTETQCAYAETMIALHRSGRSKSEIEETMAVLNGLLDEEARLLAARESSGGPADALTRLATERTALIAKAEAATDLSAREAYAQSLALLDDRVAGLRAADANVERIEAHLELLRQAVLATRDAALRFSAAPQIVPDLATDSLRAAVALARAQTTETERAIAELRAI